MNRFRELSYEEKALLVELLKSKPETLYIIGSLDGFVVKEMDDGGMGSFSLVPKDSQDTSRAFGRQLVLAEYTDRDGVPVSLALNVDSHGKLYELDVWKVNFAPLRAWPNPPDIRIVN